MTIPPWLRLVMIALGTLALSALIWFGGPLIAIGEVRPLDGVLTRSLVVAAILLTVGGITGFQIYRRRRKARELEEALQAQTDETSDGLVLKETMKDALDTLRKAGNGKQEYLYELPWYIIIGPPGSGKTTALANSGLKFPLARGATPEAVAGIGGTRYCDWWFTEDAVLIDTAGRYTTQDSDPKGDRQSWLAFLDLLKKNRPRQPINGVLVAISIEDLLTGTPEEINAHANAIRKRLTELHDQLKIDFPVYALFTKGDLIAGFSEYFGNLNETDRRMVWGSTFQTTERTRNMIGELPAEFDLLIERLTEELPDRLQEEPASTSRVILFAFPSQVAALKKPLVEFLNKVFEPTRYHANATLRGFYFTSGTQQGTPIDQLIGALAKNFGAEGVQNAAYSGLGKSYFLTDLLKKVVFAEAGWVSTNRRAVQRSRLVRAAAFGSLAAVAAVAGALWWTSYTKNRDLVAQSQLSIDEYRRLAQPVLRETLVADRDYGRVLPLLHKLRHLPTGIAFKDQPEPVSATFGLSQRDRLQSSSETAYQSGLERMFRPRLILRLEEQLEANRNNTSFLYEALKVYLMIGGKAQLDRDFVVAWMRRDWSENIYPGAANARGRQALEEHLLAMLDLELGGREPLVSLNGPLVEECQRTLARLSVAERAYELLKSQARGATARDWTVARRGGPDVALVLEGATGEDLESIRVPFFFTYAGFHEAFIDRLGDIGEHVESERWVLGAIGEQSAVASQYTTLFQDLLKLYARDFVAAWQGAIAKLRMKPLTSDKPRYVALSAASAPTSPIRAVLESIRDETRLTRERPAAAQPGKPGEAGGGVSGAQAGRTAKVIMEEASRYSSAISRANQATNQASSTGGRIGSTLPGASGSASATALDRFAVPAAEAPGANIEQLFKHFHLTVEGDSGRKPIDALLSNLGEISQAMILAATSPAQAPQANATLQVQVASLRANSARFPAPFSGMMRGFADDVEGDATGASVAQLQKAMGDQVAQTCQQTITNRYPFTRNTDREVPITDFARLFSPGGILDAFFKQNLQPHVDMSKKVWTWRPDSRVARSLSTSALREFQRAAEIRDAFFATGGNMPSVSLAVTPLATSPDAQPMKLEINGQPVTVQPGVSGPVTVQWPGATTTGRTVISTPPDFFGRAAPVFERNGAWSLYRMLDAASVLRQGDALIASLVVGGREVSYQFNVGSITNPLTLPALREFRCPAGI